MKPLDVKNWLEWKHQFQILLASQDYLEEATKLTLFLDNLGPDGRTLAFKLFPQLANFGSTSTDSVTFAEVWWQFNEYFWLKKRHQSDLEKNFFEDKKKLQLILDQDLEEVSFPLIDIETHFLQYNNFTGSTSHTSQTHSNSLHVRVGVRVQKDSSTGTCCAQLFAIIRCANRALLPEEPPNRKG